MLREEGYIEGRKSRDLEVNSLEAKVKRLENAYSELSTRLTSELNGLEEKLYFAKKDAESERKWADLYNKRCKELKDKLNTIVDCIKVETESIKDLDRQEK